MAIADHPYRFGTLGVLALLLVGGLLVATRTPVDPSGDEGRWATGTVPIDPIGYGGLSDDRGPDAAALVRAQLKNAEPASYIPQLAKPLSEEPAESQSGNGGFDSLTDLLSALAGTGEGNASSKPTEEGGDLDAFSFIPTALTKLTTETHKMSDTQRRLYDYGNSAGAEIQSFEDLYPDAIPMLRDAAEDRKNEEKQAKVRTYAKALENLGNSLLTVEPVPASVVGKHKALSESYIEVGKKLALISYARADKDLLAAVNTYNAAMDEFTEHFVSLATFFAASGVTFQPSDGGSVFSFTPVTSL